MVTKWLINMIVAAILFFCLKSVGESQELEINYKGYTLTRKINELKFA